MKEYLHKLILLRKHNFQVACKKAKKTKMCYVFLAPYALIFFTFTILPVIVAIGLSFTYYNVLEPPKWTGMTNYFSLLLDDDVFITALKNTLILAIVTGPVGYIMSFLFAWLINELPHWIRTIAVVIFYAPSLAGTLTTLFTIFFRADIYGYVNNWLIELGFIDAPIGWLVNPQYMLPVCMGVILWSSLGTGFLSFVAGLQGVDKSLLEAGCVDGVKNRWQELYYITLPSMRPMLMFGAVMSITSAFSVGAVTTALCGNPSTDYAAHTIVTHLEDYGATRYEMGYASAIATILFLMMIITNKFIQSLLRRLGT